MDKTLRDIIIVGVLAISVSFIYHFVIKQTPIQKTNFEICYQTCTEGYTVSPEFTAIALHDRCMQICGVNALD